MHSIETNEKKKPKPHETTQLFQRRCRKFLNFERANGAAIANPLQRSATHRIKSMIFNSFILSQKFFLASLIPINGTGACNLLVARYPTDCVHIS